MLAWVGSDAVVRLVYPRSMYYEPSADWSLRDEPFEWQPYKVPAGVYGIVYNPTQGIYKHQVMLQDKTTGETQLVAEMEGHNSQETALLLGGDVIKTIQDAKLDRQYILILRGIDLNGDMWDDTAVIQPRRR